MSEPRTPRGSSLLLLAACTACAAALGCDEAGAALDPDDPTRLDHSGEGAAVESRLAQLKLGPLVAASAGVTAREAPAVLATWLSASAAGRALLSRWPRDREGALDLDRAPLVAREVRVAIEGGAPARDAAPSRSSARCGEVAVLLTGLAPPAVRVRVPLPPTARTCRGARADATLEGTAALDALDEAVAAGVPPELR
jgi:phage-related tail fiber protein